MVHLNSDPDKACVRHTTHVTRDDFADKHAPRMEQPSKQRGFNFAADTATFRLQFSLPIVQERLHAQPAYLSCARSGCVLHAKFLSASYQRVDARRVSSPKRWYFHPPNPEVFDRHLRR